jgi:hypothetical protein
MLQLHGIRGHGLAGSLIRSSQNLLCLPLGGQGMVLRLGIGAATGGATLQLRCGLTQLVGNLSLGNVGCGGMSTLQRAYRRLHGGM